MYSAVLITVPDSDTGKRISRHVLEKRLAACANMFPISSMYWWDDEIVEEDECIILFKTVTEDFEVLEQELEKLHPYDTPCIVRYAIKEGHDPYLDWISSSTERSEL